MMNKDYEKKFDKIVNLVKRAIKEQNYEYIRQAADLAYEANIFMAFDDEYTAVEDEIFYHRNVF